MADNLTVAGPGNRMRCSGRYRFPTQLVE